MEWQHDRAGDGEQELNQRCEPRWIINIGGAVCSRKQVPTGLNAGRFERRRVGRRPRPHQLGNINHHVADQQRPRSKPFILKICDRHLRRAEQQLGTVVGENSVQLLRHRSVK